MLKQTLVVSISALAGVLCGLLPMTPLANAANPPTLTIGGPSGSGKAGQPETFGCTTQGYFAKGTVVTFYARALSGGAMGESGSVTVSGSNISTAQYTFGSLTAGGYEAYCTAGSAVSAFDRFTIAAN